MHANRDQVNQMFNEMQYGQEKFLNTNKFEPINIPVVGSLYAAKYTQDMSWYRVEVIDVASSSNKPIEVLFVDYGYNAKVIGVISSRVD